MTLLWSEQSHGIRFLQNRLETKLLVISNYIWIIGVLTVTLCDRRPSGPGENRCPWTCEEPDWLISMPGGSSSIKAKL